MEDKTTPDCDSYIQILRLKSLRKLGLISQDEFEFMAEMVIKHYGSNIGNA